MNNADVFNYIPLMDKVKLRKNDGSVATGKTIAEWTLLRLDFGRIAREIESKRQDLLARCTEQYPAFSTDLAEWQKDKGSHKDFEIVIADVDKEFAPVWKAELETEAELKRPLLSIETFAEIIEFLNPEDTEQLTYQLAGLVK